MREEIDVDVLKTIPGFFYDVKKESYSFFKLKTLQELEFQSWIYKKEL